MKYMRIPASDRPRVKAALARQFERDLKIYGHIAELQKRDWTRCMQRRLYNVGLNPLVVTEGTMEQQLRSTIELIKREKGEL